MIFSTVHIALTAVITGVLVLAVAVWRLGTAKWRQAVVVALLSGVAVFLWRLSANMPQLNEDGLRSFSANDWAAPMLTYLVLAGYGDLRPSTNTDRFRQTRALAALIALAVNVITI
jgi:hypothetical protein